jgi:hypothetical protein
MTENKNLTLALERLEANSGSDRTTEFWEDVRTVMEAARPKPVYLPTFVSYDGRYRDETLTEDYGYFTSQEDVEAWVEERNADRAGYDRYVQGRVSEQIKYDAAYEKAVAKFARLREAFSDPEDFMKEPTRVTVKVYTFEEWSARQEDRFGFTEVLPAEDM